LKALYRIKGNIRDMREHAFPRMGKKRLAKIQALALLVEEQCELSEVEVRAAMNARRHGSARGSNMGSSSASLRTRRAS